MAGVRKASGSGIAPMRLLLALLTAALLAGAIACEPIYDMGVAAVVPLDEGLIAITLEAGIVYDYKFSHSSQDGGLTWSERDSYRLNEYIDPRQYSWQKYADTPRGAYRIDGSDIQLHTSDGKYQTVYSAAHLLSPENQRRQLKSIKGAGSILELSDGPVSITYDPSSGNLIAVMGIVGIVVVGTPDGSWIPAGVGPYHPLDFSGS